MAKTKYDERTRDQIASDVLKEKGLFGAIGTYLSGDFPQSESLKDPQGRVIRRQKGMDILKQRQAEGKKRAARLKKEKEQQIAKNEEARKERIRAREEAIRKTVSMATGESAKQKAMSQAVRRARQAESARKSTGVLRSSANPAKPKATAKPKPTVKSTTPSSIASKPATKTKTTSVKTEVAKAVEKNKDKDKKPKRVRRANIALARKTRTARRAGGGMMKSKMASKGGAKGGKRMPPGMKAGGSASKFPDLSGDGKVTQKDILMGKGVIKKQAGGMMKSKMSSKGGAKGGRMPGGMKNGGMAKKTKKGYALGGMTKKGMAKGGAMTKKGMAKGGTNKKRAVSRKPRGVGAALRGFGKALKK